MPKIVVIIPAYNEEAYLPALLNSVETARACYAGGPGPFRYLLYKDVNRHMPLRPIGR